jgi:hypothetical protein
MRGLPPYLQEPKSKPVWWHQYVSNFSLLQGLQVDESSRVARAPTHGLDMTFQN